MVTGKAVKYPLSTEKSLRLLESENKLVFVVDKKATRAEIKANIEEAFKVKVLNVNIMVSPRGLRKAYVALSEDTPALDIATQLGMM
jgi:ribosomal protein uL23